MLIKPLKDTHEIKVVKGPNIKEVPVKEPVGEKIDSRCFVEIG